MGCWFFPVPPPPYVCAVSWAAWLLFTGVPARFVVLRLQCPGPLGSCSPVCSHGVLCCVCGVLGHLAPVHQCARWVCCVACAVSRATWLLFTGAPARCVALRVRCPGPLGSCSPLYLVGVSCCVCGVLGHLPPVHRCARWVCCFACAVSWATWLLFTGVPARCVVFRVRCPGPLGSCSPVRPLGVLSCVRSPGPLGSGSPVRLLGVLLCVCAVLGHLASCSPVCPLRGLCCACGVLGHLAPVHRCARSVRCVVCAVSSATWLLFTCAPARWVASRVRRPGPLGSCSPVCPLCVLFCVCGVLGLVAPVQRCARSVCCVACAVSWATWLLFTGVPALSFALLVRCPGPLGSHSPVCPLGVLLHVCSVLGPLAPDHCCTHPVCCFACAVPLGSCSPVRPLCPLLCWCGVLGHLALVHRFARSVCCVACAVSWATWLLFTGVPAQCVVLRVRCPGPLGSCSPVRPLRPLLCLCVVPGHLAPVHLCACLVCCFACAASWAPWLLFTGVHTPWFVFPCAVSSASWFLFTGVPARCVVLRVHCPGPLGSRSPVCPLRHLLCSCGVLGHLAPVHRCARSVCFFSLCGVLGHLASCSPVCSLGVLCCVCGVLGHLAPVNRCARSVGCVACTVSWAGWLLYTGVLALCAVLWVARVVLRGRGVAAGRSLVHPDGGCS